MTTNMLFHTRGLNDLKNRLSTQYHLCTWINLGIIKLQHNRTTFKIVKIALKKQLIEAMAHLVFLPIFDPTKL
jgi:hypothetical protein